MTPIDTATEIHRTELVEVVESVLGTMMALPVRECEAQWSPETSQLTSAVHLTGEWCGAVLLETDRDLACRFAARFLAMGDTTEAAPAEVDDVVRDVLGELSNMIGGNLKCVLTRGTRLSMPSVIDGQYSLRVCGAEVRERVTFTCQEGVFRVSVLSIRQ